MNFKVLIVAACLFSPIAANAQQGEVAFTFPPLTVSCTGANSGNAVLDLAASVPGGLSTSVSIVRTIIWLQTQGVTTAIGDISTAIDPQGYYVGYSGFPATQNGPSPALLKTLNDLWINAGQQWWSDKQLSFPIIYTPGDKIIWAPECQSSQTFQAFFTVFWLASADINPNVPPPPGASTVFSAALDSDVVGGNNISTREVIPNISVGGGHVRVQVCTHMTMMTAQHLSIGVQSGSSSSTIATPIELTFGGAHGVSLGTGQCTFSDWGALVTSVGQSLMVTTDLFNGAGENNWSYEAIAPNSNFYSLTTPAWNTAAMVGATAQANRNHIITQVQVEP